MKNVNIKHWYMDSYPTDDMGCELIGDISFGNLLATLANNGDVYELIGVGDSLIRERLFGKLSELMDVDYSVVYNLWLHG